MAFGATPLDGSVSPLPMSSAVPDGTSTPVALEAGPSLSTGGNTLAPLSIWAKDGNDIAIGTTTQTKATDGTATSWSVIQLLKGIFDKLLNTLAVTQSGTWTMQPGNVANTTAWKVDNSGVTQPVSGTITAHDVTSNVAVNVGAGNTVVKASPGFLGSVLITNPGSATLNIYDNASTNAGTIIGFIPAAATMNAIPWVFNMPAVNGITVHGTAATPNVTISFT